MIQEEEIIMNWWQIFLAAVNAMLQDISSGRFILESEKDIQSTIFYHVVLSLANPPTPVQVHAEPTKAGLKPDLVLGADDVFVEIKLSKANNGGYSQAIASWNSDINKLKTYKNNWQNAICVFIGIDEAGYHSNPTSKNYFNPATHQLQGQWQVANNRNVLIAYI